MASDNASTPTMDTLIALCKRRGFVFPSSDIYGGYNGFFDFGPLGVEVKNNIKNAWWSDFVHRRDDIVGLDSSIIMHPKIWVASGHVGGFSDPMVDCKETKLRYRADQLFFQSFTFTPDGEGEAMTYNVVVVEADDMDTALAERAAKVAKLLGKQAGGKVRGEPTEGAAIIEFTESTEEQRTAAYGPEATEAGTLTEPRDFNLMFETKVGPLADKSATAYLRPETAQGIFSNYRNVVDTGRVKVPFGIAQVGKAFRNEITPRNFLFRSREFEQMEIEYFIQPDADWQTLHREWIDKCIDWLVSIGLPREGIGEDVHPAHKLSHYSKGTTDLTFRFPHGVQELWGIACRGNFDLTQHQEHSGKSMEYFDEQQKQKYIPHVIEPSLGVDRTFLAVLSAAYCEDEIPNDKGTPEKRSVMKFHPRIAPYKAAVFPLVKNKPELVERARKLYERLQKRWTVFWDVSGAIGRRYRRQDEIGTPFCITVDFDTIEKDAGVTIRDRDTTEQIRLSEDELFNYLSEKIDG
ncbi:glycine--tRNA ligase [Ruficoccus sp. ZRK36]|uniref:glycine--tRNA ligase n=1 Tax=Ruficoccus sp. ZRK36 TaxID=2866311 RepID=UPI001C73B380|nr:glycine--tRNA ligase [Ruficoccus sp. ZRK36]QYY36497.1 glycine--tRNA ligase [Ruficoccus sp. ZRK36]